MEQKDLPPIILYSFPDKKVWIITKEGRNLPPPHSVVAVKLRNGKEITGEWYSRFYSEDFLRFAEDQVDKETHLQNIAWLVYENDEVLEMPYYSIACWK